MRARQVLIATFGATGTGVLAMLSSDALPVVAQSVPASALDAASWTWKIAAVLLVAYVALSVIRSRLSGPAANPIKLRIGSAPEVKGRHGVPSPPEPYLVHPFRGAEAFIGRDAERRALTEWIRNKNSQGVYALLGDGGTGKSALAWTWLHRDIFGEDRPDADDESLRVPGRSRPKGVLWWSFDRSGPGFSVFLDEALAYMTAGAVQPSSYLASRYQKVDNFFSILKERRFLIVLDGFEWLLRAGADVDAVYSGDLNADTPRDQVCQDLHAAELLRRIASGRIHSRVLITSRVLPAELDEPPCPRKRLADLEPAHAVALLKQLKVEGEPDELEAACARYGCRPLTLQLLAGIVRGRKQWGNIRRARNLDEGIVDAALKSLNPDGLVLLSHLAVFRSEINAEEAAMIGSKRGTAQELVDRGLVSFADETGRLNLHPLVRQAAYGCLRHRQRVHSQLAEYFALARLPAPITEAKQLQPVFQQYHHLVSARRYDDAYAIFSSRLASPLRDRFADPPLLLRLLNGLFDGTRPRLRNKQQRAELLQTLAEACTYSGEPRRAAELCEANLRSFGSRSDQDTLRFLLEILAGAQSRLGRLESAEQSLLRLVELTRERDCQTDEAVARTRLGLLLAHRAEFDEALAEFDTAFALVEETGDRQVQSVCFSYYTQRALLMGDGAAARDAAAKSRALVEEAARRSEPNEHDYVRTGWLLGASYLAVAAGGDKSALRESERYLSDALARCRRGDLVGYEPDLLLTWAKWHRVAGSTKDAAPFARDALAIAQRCEYRLKTAEAHNFLGRLALDAGDTSAALASAQLANEHALCDGLPYCYKPALDEAQKLLAEIGVSHKRLNDDKPVSNEGESKADWISSQAA